LNKIGEIKKKEMVDRGGVIPDLLIENPFEPPTAYVITGKTRDVCTPSRNHTKLDHLSTRVMVHALHGSKGVADLIMKSKS
jgi:hypothetical protein